MKIKSEKQSSTVHEPGAECGSSPLPFDPEKYRKYLAETGWSEKAQDEYLETLWNMMGTFVDLAWGTDSVQTVLKTERPSSPENLQPGGSILFWQHTLRHRPQCARRFDAIPYAFIPLSVLRSDHHRDPRESQFASGGQRLFLVVKTIGGLYA